MKIILTKSKNKKSIIWYSIFALIILIFGANSAMAEWQEPGSPPPVEDFYAPITTTSEPQAKEGYLLIDPVNYHPRDDSSLNFSINKPLVVYGTGTKFSTDRVYNDILIVDSDTLYADAFLEYVSIGTKSRNADEMLNIVGQTVQIGTSADPIIGRALSSYSNDDYGIYTNTGTVSNAGFYGINTSSLSRAVYGESLGNNLGVRGESVDGMGIYAATDSSTFGAVYGNNESTGFAGYFNGRVNSVSDLVADVFLPSALQKSIIPFTSGQLMATYPIPTNNYAYTFDGNYFYFGGGSPDVDSNNFYVIDSKDGRLIKSLRANGWGLNDLEFDGRYVIGLNNYGDLVRYDPRTDAFVALDGDLTGLHTSAEPYQYPLYSNPITVGTINGVSYVWAPNEDHDYIVRVKVSELGDGASATIDTIDLTSDVVIPNNPGTTGPYGVDFDGKYLWVANAGTDNIARIWGDLDDPNGYANNPGLVIDTNANGLDCNARDVDYDGTYAWCMTSSTAGETLVRIWADDPFDPKHPPISVGPSFKKLLGMSFDGTYNWAVGHENEDKGLVRILASDPSQFDIVDPDIQSHKTIFDGTYIWLMDEATTTLKKYYSGSGMGRQNLKNITGIDTRSGLCTNPIDPGDSSNLQCVYDYHCPTYQGTFGTNGDGVIEYAIESSNPGTRDPFAIAIDETYMYLAGYTNQFDFQIEKRSLYNGHLCTPAECGVGFGPADDGIINGDATNSRIAYDIAIDDTYMYVAGDDDNNDWHIEKRLLSDGSLVAGFGTNGVLTGDPTLYGGQTIYAIAVDDNYIYAAGNNSNFPTGIGTTTSQGGASLRIIKYDKDTGDICTGGNCAAGDFGDGTCTIDSRYYCQTDADCNTVYGSAGTCDMSSPTGIIQRFVFTPPPVDGTADTARDIVIDGTYMYVVGHMWTIEKRFLNDGSLETAFDGDGRFYEQQADDAYRVALQGSDLYIAGLGDDFPNNYKIEKRNATTGALDNTFDGDGRLDSNQAIEVKAMVVSSSAIFIGGIYNDGWAIEKWNLDGTLDTNFAGDGVANVNSDESNDLYDFALDSNDQLYTIGNNRTGGVHAWRIDKRQTVGAQAGQLGNILGDEICSTGNSTQVGDIYIENSSSIYNSHCYANSTHYFDRSCTTATVATDCNGLLNPECIGGDIIVNDDIQALNNLWGGICEDGITACTTNSDCAVACYGGTVAVDADGYATCDEGDYIGGIELDANSKLTNIFCWEL